MRDDSCSCSLCVGRCHDYPGWMTPWEAAVAIDAGFAFQLMRDRWESDSLFPKTEVLCPAVIGAEGQTAPPNGLKRIRQAFGFCQCTFVSENRCQIHESGFKPLECRRTFACDAVRNNDSAPPALEIVPLWRTKFGRAVIRKWNNAVTIERGKNVYRL